MESSCTTVKREIIIKAAPERVWRALTVPEERNRWETRSCVIELEVGGIVELDYGWGVSYRGTIKELVELHKMVVADSDDELTIWTLDPHPEGTLVSIEYTGLWSDDYGIMTMENMAYGTYRFMTNMKSVLEHGPDIRLSFWKSWIGINHHTYQHNDLAGCKVVQVIDGTPAEGILHVGDIIVNVNGVNVRYYDEFEEIVTSIDPVDTLKITYLRNGKPEIAEIITAPYGQRQNSLNASVE